MSQKLKARFTAVLPRIVRHARVQFCHIKCWHTKEDKIAEVQAHCWKWVRLLHKARKRWWSFVSRLADFAVRAVKSGRKIAGMTVKDVMSEINQARKGYCLCKLPDFSTESTNPLVEALTDNTQTPVDDAVAFRIDFPAWMARHSDRDRALLTDMAMNHRTKDLADRYQMSEGRVSQKRREFHKDWERYTGDAN
jgi:hypothetical protein